MAQLTLYKQDSSEAGKAELKDSVFKAEVNESVLHDSVVRYLAAQRQGTAATKTRGEVSGGGIKPWKQKHTGRARQGSIRAPQWKGGGTVWGPQPRDYRVNTNKSSRRIALKSALSAKAAEGSLILLESFEMAAPKTKDVAAFLKKFKADTTRSLIVADTLSEAVKKSSRNIAKLSYTTAGSLHPYDLLQANHVFMTLAAAKKIEEGLA